MLADALLRLELARPVVYRAAYSVARGMPERALDVSMAKAYASDAATLASRVALQTHGAIGYTWEHDLHLWMKRGWALAAAWGDAAWHRARVGAAVLPVP
jgi:alkylation response protein AidB-like acyl-CoA dehydrogenase